MRITRKAAMKPLCSMYRYLTCRSNPKENRDQGSRLINWFSLYVSMCASANESSGEGGGKCGCERVYCSGCVIFCVCMIEGEKFSFYSQESQLVLPIRIAMGIRRLHSEPPQLLYFDSDADPDPAFSSDADPGPYPDSASQNDADPDQQHWPQ
jgi:hypothetical protein